MSDHSRMLSIVFKGGRNNRLKHQDALDIVNELLESGYGPFKVAQAIALEEAADAIETQSGSQWWTKKDFTNWLYRRAYEIFPGRASL